MGVQGYEYGFKEDQFLVETLNALLHGGARIGKDHYSVSLTRAELIKLRNNIKEIDSI